MTAVTLNVNIDGGLAGQTIEVEDARGAFYIAEGYAVAAADDAQIDEKVEVPDPVLETPAVETKTAPVKPKPAAQKPAVD